jgi:hypothetical protein
VSIVVSFISAREARARRVCSSSSTFRRDRHFPDVTSSPRRPIIVADFRAKKESASRNPTETGAQQRSEGARMGRGGDCRAVRAAWCASLVTLALVARAKGEVATYSGACDVIPEPPRLIPRI